jgi:hypothetical protein
MAKTPINTNITDDDANASGINANVINTSTISTTATPPTTGNALLVHNPYISRKITGTANNPVTIYQTIPTSGQISSADDGMLVIAPIYARNPFNNTVPLETAYTSADGNRLKVDAQISSVVKTVEGRCEPRMYYNTTANPIAAGVEESLFSYTGTGKLDQIIIKANASTFEIVLKVSGVQVYRISIDSLANIMGLKQNMGQSTFTYDTALGFIDLYTTPTDFLTSFEVLAKNIAATSKSVLGVLIRYGVAI